MLCGDAGHEEMSRFQFTCGSFLVICVPARATASRRQSGRYIRVIP
jgi:hypothetical protein